MPRKQVVIIGGGFGGLTAARSLRDADVLLIDRTNHHLFQPLLYQVATAGLSAIVKSEYVLNHIIAVVRIDRGE